MTAIPSDRLLGSPCIVPAPVLGTYNPATPGYIVEFHKGVDPSAETRRLARRYGFSPSHVFRFVPGFSALLSDEIVFGLRCEPSVKLIEHDGVIETD